MKAIFQMPPDDGTWVTITSEGLKVPDNPIIGFIPGDGVGPDIWKASRKVFDAAVFQAFQDRRRIFWWEIPAGESSFEAFGEHLTQQALDAIQEAMIVIKGPLTTPVGGGFRSINVTLRQKLDLYACVRPVKYISGTPAPVIHPENVDMIIFRENTEDLYAGIEWRSGSNEAAKMISFLRDGMSVQVDPLSGIGIKPMSPKASKRLVRKAIKYALQNHRKKVTLVHKGNIMKFTEGAFRDWGYEVAAQEFGDVTITESQLQDDFGGTLPEGKILVNDRIADSMFQQVLLRPKDYEVLVTPNLNGDYISDALAAQVGGLGMAPGANIGDGCAIFEATHGSAPKYAGLDKVNPGSMLLSGVMMFDYLGWNEVAAIIMKGISSAIHNKTVTYDLARQMEGAQELSCSAFGDAVVEQLTKD